MKTVRKRLWAIGLVWIGILGLGYAIVTASLPAGASDVELRISMLESEINQLQSQMRQIDSLLSRSSPLHSAPSLPTTPSRSAPTQPYSTDPMFDRLATLVIELKEDLRALETRVEVLESSPPLK